MKDKMEFAHSACDYAGFMVDDSSNLDWLFSHHSSVGEIDPYEYHSKKCGVYSLAKPLAVNIDTPFLIGLTLALAEILYQRFESKLKDSGGRV